jgi:hypothetical protein
MFICNQLLEHERMNAGRDIFLILGTEAVNTETGSSYTNFFDIFFQNCSHLPFQLFSYIHA